MACRIGKSIHAELECKISNIYYWTESTVALGQVRDKIFPVFVSSRIGVIREQTDISQWHWIPSDQNVADLANNENMLVNLKPDCKWFTGPAF